MRHMMGVWHMKLASGLKRLPNHSVPFWKIQKRNQERTSRYPTSILCYDDVRKEFRDMSHVGRHFCGSHNFSTRLSEMQRRLGKWNFALKRGPMPRPWVVCQMFEIFRMKNLFIFTSNGDCLRSFETVTLCMNASEQQTVLKDHSIAIWL